MEEAIFLISVFYKAQLESLATVITNKDNKGKYIFKTKSVAGEKSAMSYVLLNWINIWQAQLRKATDDVPTHTIVNQTSSQTTVNRAQQTKISPWSKELKCWLTPLLHQ